MNKFLNKKKSREIVIFNIKKFFFHVNDTVKVISFLTIAISVLRLEKVNKFVQF